ncbi:EamA family transporter [Rubrobacter marinus]|uniref:EamA family transporter n=1 Tax=Rubrobacter marinus TaxID=2653852 RepID=A0A6G8Q0G8_9ACTN|nr:EamA family transporter [Rubrobacter marinus]QIN79974.1 EamA family transporter [Rubrobacter marinus]
MGAVFAFLCAVGFSCTNVLIRKGGGSGADNGMLITTICNVVILSFIVAIFGLAGRSLAWNMAGFLWFAGSGLLTSFLGRSTLFTSIGLVGSSRAAAIKNTAPMFTVGVAVLFLSEHLSPVAAGGVGLACLGLFLLVYEAFRKPANGKEIAKGVGDGRGAEAPSAESQEPSGAPTVVIIGTLIAVASAVFFGLGQGVRKVGLAYMPDAFLGATIASWTALILYLVAITAQGRTGTVFRESFTGLHPYFWLAGVATTVGQLGFFIAITYSPVAHVSVIAASETLLTIVLATLFMGRIENVSRLVLLAGCLVFCGAVVIALT